MEQLQRVDSDRDQQRSRYQLEQRDQPKQSAL
jgi:hypothetical protein